MKYAHHPEMVGIYTILLAAFAEEEYRQHTGTHVRSGKGFVGAQEQLAGFAGCANPFCQRLSLFPALSVSRDSLHS